MHTKNAMTTYYHKSYPFLAKGEINEVTRSVQRRKRVRHLPDLAQLCNGGGCGPPQVSVCVPDSLVIGDVECVSGHYKYYVEQGDLFAWQMWCPGEAHKCVFRPTVFTEPIWKYVPRVFPPRFTAHKPQSVRALMHAADIEEATLERVRLSLAEGRRYREFVRSERLRLRVLTRKPSCPIHSEPLDEPVERIVGRYLYLLGVFVREPDVFEEQMFGRMFGVKVDAVHSIDFGGLSQVLSGIMDAVERTVITLTGGPGVTGQTVRYLLKGLVPLAAVCVLSQYVGMSLSAAMAAVRSAGYEVVDWIWGSEVYEAQWGDKGECETIGKMLLAGFMGWMLTSKTSVQSMFHMITKFPPFISAAKGMTEMFMEFAQWMLSSASEFFGGKPIRFFEKRAKQVSDWMLEVRTEIAACREDIGKPERVVRMYRDGLAFRKEYGGTPVFQDIDRVMRELDATYQSCSAAIAQIRGARAEPLCVVLEGDPGCGKSNMISMLHGYVMAYTFPDEVRTLLGKGMETSCMMYQKDTGEYWAGYDSTRHKTLVIDDGAAFRAAVGNTENDWSVVMRVINTHACPLEMADVESKGVTYFRSPLVIITTNLKQSEWVHHGATVLHKPEAIQRRLRMFISVRVRPDRRDGCTNKIAPEFCALEDSWDLVAVEDGQTTIHFTNVRALAKHISERMLAREAHHSNLMQAVRTGIREILEPQMLGIGAPTDEDLPRFSWFTYNPVVRGMNYIWNCMFPGAMSIAVADPNCCPGEAAEFAWWFESAEQFVNEAGQTVRNFSKASEDFFRSAYDTWGKAGTYFARNKRLCISVGGALAMLGTVLHAFWSKYTGRVRTRDSERQVIPNFVTDEASDQEIESKLKKNLYSISLYRGAELVVPGGGNILFVHSNCAIFPAHYFQTFASWDSKFHESTEPMWVTFTNSLGMRFREPLDRFLDPGVAGACTKSDCDGIVEDMTMMRLNAAPHTSLVGRFVSLTDTVRDLTEFTWYQGTDGALEKTEFTARFGGQETYGTSYTHHITRSISYEIKTKQGDCGSAICIRGRKNGARVIAGIHVAGNRGGTRGFACVVTDEWIAKALLSCSKPRPGRNDTGDTLRSVDFDPQMNRGPLGPLVAYKSELGGHASQVYNKPSMYPTSLIGWAECEKKPADVTFEKTREALEAYAGDSNLFGNSNGSYVYAAHAVLTATGCPAQLNGRLLSVAEACSGLNVDGRIAESINHSTSSGYPLRNMGYSKDKIWDKQGTLLTHSPAFKALEENVQGLLDRARRGERIVNVFQVSPKAELRKPGKLPRVIQGAPLHYVVAWRMYFWSFMRHYSEWEPEKEVAIGMNPFEDWNRLATYICDDRHAEMVGAGDYKAFDQCHEPHISLALGEAVIGRYPLDEHNTARYIMWRDLCGPHVLFGGMVYKLHKGLPSGHPATAVVNSLYNCMLFRLCFASLLCGTDEKPLGDDPSRAHDLLFTFPRYVRLAVLGDDNIFSSRLAEFNEMALCGLMKRFHATYTLDDKEAGPAEAPFRTIGECTFVGRAFYYDPVERRYLPSLRMGTIKQMGQYTTDKRKLSFDWYMSVLKDVLGELSYHPQEVWNEMAPIVKEAWERALGVSLPLLMVGPTAAARQCSRGEYAVSICRSRNL